jgi:hypothetical protein
MLPLALQVGGAREEDNVRACSHCAFTQSFVILLANLSRASVHLYESPLLAAGNMGEISGLKACSRTSETA